MVQLAVVEVQRPQHQEAGLAGTDWATTGIYFLKEVHLLVPRAPPPAPHPPPTADTGTAATKDTDAGKTLFPLPFFGYCAGLVYFLFKCLVSLCLPVIPAHSQTAAYPVTSDLSCHDEEEDAVAVMTEIEDVEVGREDEEEEEKPTEEGGK